LSINSADPADAPSDFIRDIIRDDLRTGKHQLVVSRFPPEPNGYLHIGHAKSICLNFGIVEEFGGRTHLRFDDTNPQTEDIEYVEAIKRDIRWLGFDWGEHLYFASDYFERLYQIAVDLIKTGQAYVCSLSEAEIREYRGSIVEAGRESPYRDRSVAENLDLFARMRAGEFSDGTHVLRAKIDMAATNMKMRDPLLYRIKRAHHYRSGDAWCIYPMYDYAHPLSDAFEGITHSLCSLEFENNRELYDWVVAASGIQPQPRQIEFARLNVGNTLMSKRKLLQLVQEQLVDGWDDPRMPTISGLRRRGATPEAIRDFCERVGVARTFNIIDLGLLEHCLRDDLNSKAQRVMGVLRPLKLVIQNYPDDQVEVFDAPFWPHDIPKTGSRPLPFCREILIEADDFALEPPAGYHRLAPGREVRLRYAYIVQCVGVVRDDDGAIVEVRCTYDPESRGGQSADGRQVKGTIHWVSARHALPATVRLYDRLFTVERPDEEEGDFRRFLNPRSLESVEAKVEPSLATALPGQHFQLERLGYFVADAVETRAGRLVLNRTVTLRDTWAKIAQKPEALEAQRLAAAKAAVRAEHKAKQRDLAQVESALELEGELKGRAEALLALGLSEKDARLLALDQPLAEFFQEARRTFDQPKSLAKWIANELMAELKDRTLADLPFGPVELAQLVELTEANTITGTAAKRVLAVMVERGGTPTRWVDELGLIQVKDDMAMRAWVDGVLAGHPDQVTAFRQGKEALLGFFVGQVMKASGGAADAQTIRPLLLERLRA
jgi:glutaminyl-tRNA synthetase